MVLDRQRVLEEWAAVALSERGEGALGRFFDRALRETADPVLVRELLSAYGRYMDLGVWAPEEYADWTQVQLAPLVTVVREWLAGAGLPVRLRDLLLDYLELGGGWRYTYAALVYYEELVRELQRPLSIHDLYFLLIRLEFNHLDFFDLVSDHLATMDPFKVRYQLLALAGRPVRRLHPDWAPITQMLLTWLSERPNNPKISLNISVAQLACLLKYLDLTDLQSTFKLVAACVATKKQETISAHSLSKNYYSITQKTAATTLDLLESITRRLRRDFFPD